MNHRGETRELAAIARPTIAVVNNAQREHQEFMRERRRRRGRARRRDRGAAARRRRGASTPTTRIADVWRDAARARRARRSSTFGARRDAPTCARDVDAARRRQRRSRCARRQGDADVALARAGPAHGAQRARGGRRARWPPARRSTPIVRGLEAFRPVAGPARRDRARDRRACVHRRQLQRESRFGARGDRRARARRRRALAGARRHGRGRRRRARRSIARSATTRASAGIDRLLRGRARSRREAARGVRRAARGTSTTSTRWRARLARATRRRASRVLVKGSRFMRMERVVRGARPATRRREAH